MQGKEYQKIVDHYERCLAEHGDTHRGVDWPNSADAETRYRVMLEVVRPPNTAMDLLDFGCGASHLYEHLLRADRTEVRYSGLDISPRFVELSRSKFPQNTYYCVDVLDADSTWPEFDYIVLNGVFTEKRELDVDAMSAYFQAVVRRVFAHARKGIAFNVMSKRVDWEREDLFHLSFDDLTRFLTADVSRHFVIRHDYGLYEYTTYVYRQPPALG